MDTKSCNILKSQGYARAQVLDTDSKMANLSPVKTKQTSPLKLYRSGKSPMKENSPLKKMGLLRKQSSMASQENSQSPLKAFGGHQGPSPQKMGSAKMLLNKGNSSGRDSESSSSISPLKVSPLKKQMRMF